MGALLTAGYALTAGPQRWVEQLVALDVTLAVGPAVDRLLARFPVDAPVEAMPGDDVLLSLDNGEGEADVFAGRVSGLRRRLDGVELSAVSAGGLLARTRVAETFEHASAKSVIEALAAGAGVEVGSLDGGVDLAFYVADPRRTAWEHVTALAGFGGALASIDATGRLQTRTIGDGTADRAFRYGRDTAQLMQPESLDSGRRVVVAGGTGAGTMSDPAILRPVTDTFGGSRPDGPGGGTRFGFAPALRTADGAARAGAHATRLTVARPRAERFELWLQPAIRPGERIELQELPERFDAAPAWVESVRHRLDARGGVTRVVANRDPVGFDPQALLGSLGGALSAVF